MKKRSNKKNKGNQFSYLRKKRTDNINITQPIEYFNHFNITMNLCAYCKIHLNTSCRRPDLAIDMTLADLKDSVYSVLLEGFGSRVVLYEHHTEQSTCLLKCPGILAHMCPHWGENKG